MKLCLSTSICASTCARALAVLAAVALVGCGASTQASQAPVDPASAMSAAPAVSATTQLMFADLASPAHPAPKVGKAHLVLGEDVESRDATGEPSLDADDLGAPKEARRSDGSRRGGHFGTTK
jgi:hypothetical protein